MITKYQKLATNNTITRNVSDIEENDSIFRIINMVSKRSTNLKEIQKRELYEKLKAFHVETDSLLEIFENKEQIEVSKYYESLPKSVSVALEEYLNGVIKEKEINEEIEDDEMYQS